MIASKPKYPGIRITTNGNQLVALYTEARITAAGVYYPITPSTEMGEIKRQDGKHKSDGESYFTLRINHL